MLLTSRLLFADLSSTYSLYNLCFNRIPTRSLSIALRQHQSSPAHLQILELKSLRPHKISSFMTRAEPVHLRVIESESSLQKDVVDGFNLDSLLSLAELSCLLSSAVVSVGFAVNSVIAGSKKDFIVAMGNNVMLSNILMLAGGVIVGAWIRRRQWRRVCRETAKGELEINLLKKIEKLEEDLRNLATVIRVLSRQLEKLGIKFRITRKALKEPITETAALAQKNSEATRALAVQSDILEKELGEIQKVLLAMQEQQRKQLDLILAIGKTGKLWESKRPLETTEEQDSSEMSNSAEDEVKQKQIHQI